MTFKYDKLVNEAFSINSNLNIKLVLCRKSCDIIFVSAAGTLRFEGTHSMTLVFNSGLTHEADDLLLRFRTKEQNGLILSTIHDRSLEKLEIKLEASR